MSTRKAAAARRRRFRWLRWPVGAIAIVVLLHLLFPDAPPLHADAEGNILKNGDFEQRGGGVPGWTIEPKIAGQGKISIVTGKVHSGQGALELVPNNKNRPNGSGDGPLRVAEGFPAGSLRGKRLYLSAYMSAEGGATAIVGALVLRSKGMPILVEMRQDSSRPGFVHQQNELAVPDAGDIQILVVGCSIEGNSGAAYFDDVYVGTKPLQDSAEASVPQANPASPSAGGPLAATVEVDASREIRPIPPTLYGANVEWIWNANGLWDLERKEINPQAVRLSRDLGVTLLRFPGGVFANYYHWKDGIGPESSRKETEHTPGGPRSAQVFGTDEALSFAQQTGSHLMITVNALTGTPQEAAEWVRYVNGKNQPDRRVDYWEIGNELYVGNGNKKGMTPDEYASRFLDFARAMRAADPSIQLGAIADDNYGRTIPHAHADWAQRVLSKAGQQIDFLSVHNAYAPIIPGDTGSDVRTVYSAMLAAPALIRQSLDDVAAKIKRFAPPGRGSHIKIAVTEWGPLFQGTPKDRFVEHVQTLGSGLFVASTLKTFIESPQTGIANFFKLVDPLYAGWIGQRNGTFVPTGPYYAFEMFTRHFGKIAVSSSAQSPTYRSVSVGWVDAVQSVPYLDVVASRSNNGRTLYVLGINKNFDHPVRAKIELHGFQPAGKATAWTLNGSGIDANTGSRPVAVPGVKWGKQAEDSRNPHFDRGGPDEIKLTSAALKTAGESFEYTFPAHSVTSLEIGGRLR
ncbi:MAG TPA: alpha-L-arabinofuranosidase C-terminal domain-containing protein [Bryobacteraceae bacterium]|nr:alpha-L-arabinofuranosidase C-terminal domain-containing protein [Bryobacteraceae bacterium]